MSEVRFCTLIIDDNPTDLLLIAKAFKDSEVLENVFTFSNHVDAMDYLKGVGVYSNRGEFPYPTILILASTNSKDDDFRLLKNFKGNPSVSSIPVIIFSGSIDPQDIQRAYKLGAASYFVKPINYEKLRSLIRTIYDYWEGSVTNISDNS